METKLTLEQRAHDIAVRVLPYALGEDFEYYSQKDRAYDSFEITHTYEELYFAILERLREFRDL